MKVISEKCKKCLSCVDVCPVQAISCSEKEASITIDSDVCLECGCCVSACSHEAIVY